MDASRRRSKRSDAGAVGAPRPDAAVPALDAQQLDVLRQVGQEWSRVCADPDVWRRALPVDPNLGSYPQAADFRPTRFGRFVTVAGRRGQLPPIQATVRGETPPTWFGRAVTAVRHVVLGPPLAVSAIAVERMRKLVALPVLSADALSSVAYGPEAMLAVLVVAGGAGAGYSLPIAAVIALLMLAVGVSYRQTIRAYPHGGGSYIVAGDNLGRLPGLVAAAGLMVDYIMTVAVSVASGVQAITSAVPSLAPSAVPLGLSVIALLLAGNLRGVRQAGALFAAPTYAFIVAMVLLIATGLLHAAAHGFHPQSPPHLAATGGVGVLLVLRAFSSGSTAMTGIEAVSDSVPAFRPVEWRNARATLTWMVLLLVTIFAGTVLVIHFDGVLPSNNQTVLSQLAHRHYGTGFMYGFTQASTAAILLLAANTAYNDFPRVLFLMARNCEAPRQFLRIGDRLAFSNGIIMLSAVSALIYAAFGGNTLRLIPLYAVGVFLAFTVSQTGMVLHWWRGRDDRHWRRSLILNATGGVASAIVFITAAVTKFTEGAWVAVLVVGAIILIASRIHGHYRHLGRVLALRPHAVPIPSHPVQPHVIRGRRKSGRTGGRGASADARKEEREEQEAQPEEIRHLTVVPVAALDLAGMRALAYAASLQQPLLALHISPTKEEAERFEGYWDTWGDHLPLEVIVSPHRAIVAPLVNYIWSLHRQRPDLTLTVVIPEIVEPHSWQRVLHNRTGARIRRALRRVPEVVVTTIPLHVPET